MRTLSVILAAAIGAAMLFPGCKKSDKDSNAKPAKPGNINVTHNKGERGGKKFHLAEGDKDNHDYLCECVFKDGKLALYVVDHDDTTKTIKAEETEISITDLKHDGKDLPAIKLAAMEKEGDNWFEASGDAIPAEIKDYHDLAGGTFTVTVGKTKLNHTFKKSADASHEKEKKEKAKKTS